MNIDLKVVQRGLVFSNDDPGSPQRVACYPSLACLNDGSILLVPFAGASEVINSHW
jgi:hypothetical protein